ncbi:putative B3 domain-containing protein At2g27410 [Arabidopsis lyrata subsp. lyrata]|uniref:putative B3 domain-containing protein At2g27410 n=1 Tax=Arabidopsis lyrata subsp. lyrata TaxID=81972 RepID=UPI000A29BD9A|nr:putative B3 domain-containing protein At2g27410 [Arabidopsis lyrata subsp. lyrata]|eukprot:XP_020885111.1 putative B3 domain-containing protein At2g27410 [Arabidopsis lyrata subsp. lyrata]
MGNYDDPRVSESNFEMLLHVAAMVYDQEYGTHEDEKSKTIDEETEIEARIFGDKVPRKNRTHRSSPSFRKTRAIEQQRSSELQNPNTESEPSSSSCVTQFKKRLHMNTMEERSLKKPKIDGPLEVEPIQTTPPDWLLNVMRREENGYNPKLISTRKLFKTDLASLQARLSVPFRQVKNPDFLTEEETRIINEQALKIRKEGVSVDLVDPLLKKHVLDLRKWKMTGNWYYVFVDGWKNVLAANSFKVDDFFPLWSFRSGKGKLCFALVPPTASHEGASTSGECSHGNPLLDDDSGHCAGECSNGCSSFRDSPPL